MQGYFRTTQVSSDKKLRAYVIGVALGDGSLSNPNGRACCLRITCDTKYPNLIEYIHYSLSDLLPDNKVHRVHKKGCVDVCIYSNHLEKLLGWKAGHGPKHVQNVSVPKWIKQSKDTVKQCLKGLIQTDGSIYSDRGYQMINFVTVNPHLAKDFEEMVYRIDYECRVYHIIPSNPKQLPRFNIRICKKTQSFISEVGCTKN